MGRTRSGERQSLFPGSSPPSPSPSPEQVAPYSIEQAHEALKLVRETWQSRTLARLVLAARSYQRGRDVAETQKETQEELRELFHTAYELAIRLRNVSPAAKSELGWTKPGEPARTWGSITGNVVSLVDLVEDKAAPPPGRGAPRLPARPAMLMFIREIAKAYWLATGRKPGISKSRHGRDAPPAGGARSGPFLRFLKAAIAPFPDLAEKKDGNLDDLFREAMQGVDPDTGFGRNYLRRREPGTK